MPDGGFGCTHETLRELVEVVTAPGEELPARLSHLLMPFVPHRALIMFAADATGGHRGVAGDPGFADRVSYLDLDGLRRDALPGSLRDVSLPTGETLQVVSRNGALLLLADPVLVPEVESTVLDLWTIVALRVQELADAASPMYLQLARATSGERMEVLADLSDDYSMTLETVLGALRSPLLDDSSARASATAIAAGGLVHLRTAGAGVRAATEEPVTTAFQRLRDDLRPLVRYRDLDVQFVEPPVDGRPLPGEVAHGARAVVRGVILALIDLDLARIRVQWDCDGTNLLIDMRDDGRRGIPDDSVQLELVKQRVHALGGRIAIENTPGWGSDMAIVIPLDPPHIPPRGITAWALRPRELDVLRQLATGRRNRDIAAELKISENTVKFHVASIYRKLGVRSRAEATALYLLV
jgi:DNA-binding CsgD family transcriptional regulator